MVVREPQNLIGQSPAFTAVLEQVSQLAPLSKPILIVGERGTGKELIAERLHFLSKRWENPFLKLNCAALTESLLETELFGHEAGAFTGAAKRRKGRFELADNGSLFLDELANTSLGIQEKILRVVEYGEFERVGSSTTISTDVRLIGATNMDLPAQVKAGKFRADLLDRLAFDVITLPPLRVRIEDIQLLAEHFATKMASELEREYFAGFAKSARAALMQYAWPGNVRELKNVVERAVYRNDDVEAEITQIDFDPFESPWRPLGEPVEPSVENPAVATTILPPEAFNLKDHIQQTEIDLIEAALKQNKYKQKQTAEYLGMTYHQLRGYLRKYDISDKDD
ncbi:MAG: phage shock protein operon transcriptional activator [Xanthomonadales bacterium]|nr:phage shock protein operon transcriptional activator [Xanthomonadales bacterium]